MRALGVLFGRLALGAAVLPCPAWAATVEVVIEHFAYSPARVLARPGDTLVFVNRDIVPHTATAADGAWDTGELGHDARGRVTVPAAGGRFVCGFHPDMAGELVVVGDARR